jgi:hypothetical protein
MAVDWGLDFDLSEWAGPASVAAGALLAVLIFWCGRLAADRRWRPTPAAPAKTSPPPDPFVQGSVGERRQAPRRPGSQVAVLVADALGQSPPYRGIVIDRSVGGVRLGVDQAVEVGTILSIRPAHAPPMIPWTQVEVIHLRRADGGWVLGCQFVQPPPSTVLWMFG